MALLNTRTLEYKTQPQMRPIALLVLTLMHVAAAAQSYRPLLDTSAYWQDENGWASPGPNTSSFECRRYFLDGDSVVNSLNYKILRQTGRYGLFNGIDPDLSYTIWLLDEYVALLREDTTSHRAYIIPEGWTTEWLLYDFSVGVGPYPPTYRYYQEPNLEVVSVDTLVLPDGPHRRLNFNAYSAVVEGIGGTTGFLDSWSSGEIHWIGRLVCQSIAGTPSYLVSSNDCACDADVRVPARPSSVLSIHPSPTAGTCRLDGAVPMSLLTVHALDGRVVLSGTCDTKGSAAMDLTSLPSGLYVVQVQDVHGPVKMKVVKE